ncbi:DNA gyrase inhibitor YacG [Acidobacteria bacterium AH-259-D05]|nr:DNA gyrase inhibitor YacG [Acidobacteria bacterium AH-259-D05]
MTAKEPSCPACDRKVSRDNPVFPFCSERCRLLDLGKWLGGGYRIPGRKVSETETEAEE